MTAAEKIEDLLRPDPRLVNPEDAWRDLTTAFPECLRAFVAEAHHMSGDEADRRFGAFEEDIKWWRTDMVHGGTFPREGVSRLSKAQVERQLTTMDHLVQYARATVRSFGGPTDEDWALACQDWFRGRGGWSATVAVAGVGREQGRVHTLCVDVLPVGSGRLSHHPRDALAWSPPDALFRESMRTAWKAAQGVSEQHATYDGRYRLLEGPFAEHEADRTATTATPVPSPAGASAGGAAARAWCYLLRGGETVPDPGVVVLAGIARDGDGPFELTAVERIGRKAAAVAEVNRERAQQGPWLDTLVVASNRNRLQAEEALSRMDLAVPVRVVLEHDLRRLGPID